MFPPILFSLIITLILVGLILWVAEQLPIDGTIKNIIRVVVIVCVVVWLLTVLFGYASAGPHPFRPY